MDEYSWKKQFNEKTTVPHIALKLLIVLYPSISTGTINKKHGDSGVWKCGTPPKTAMLKGNIMTNQWINGFDVSLNGLRFPLKMDPVTMKHHEQFKALLPPKLSKPNCWLYMLVP